MKRTKLYELVLVLALISVAFMQVSSHAEAIRDGNRISYEWEHKLPWGSSIQLSFWIDFVRGWQYMQDRYSELSHRYQAVNARYFIYQDPFYHADLRVTADAIRDLSNSYGLNKVDVALSFVQSLSYNQIKGYQRYAVETLIDGKGDCSDKSVLLGGLLSMLGYDWVFFHLPGHLAIGIKGTPDLPGTYVFHNGRYYYFCETTSKGKPVGYCPDEYIDESVDIE